MAIRSSRARQASPYPRAFYMLLLLSLSHFILAQIAGSFNPDVFTDETSINLFPSFEGDPTDVTPAPGPAFVTVDPTDEVSTPGPAAATPLPAHPSVASTSGSASIAPLPTPAAPLPASAAGTGPTTHITATSTVRITTVIPSTITYTVTVHESPTDPSTPSPASPPAPTPGLDPGVAPSSAPTPGPGPPLAPVPTPGPAPDLALILDLAPPPAPTPPSATDPVGVVGASRESRSPPSATYTFAPIPGNIYLPFNPTASAFVQPATPRIPATPPPLPRGPSAQHLATIMVSLRACLFATKPNVSITPIDNRE